MLVRVWIFGVSKPLKPTSQYIDPMLNPAGLSLCDNVSVSVCIMAVILINGDPEPGKTTLQCLILYLILHTLYLFLCGDVDVTERNYFTSIITMILICGVPTSGN